MAPITEEDLKNMSPEEILDLQKKNCIFCHIVNKRVQSRIIYEDEKAIAVLDVSPANPGHVLVLPKEHYSIMPQVPEDILDHLGMVTKALSQALLRALQAKGVTVFIANGLAAGQKAQHFMIHIIPRKENDDAGIKLLQKAISDAEFEKLKALLRPKVLKAFGMVEMEEVEEKIAIHQTASPAEEEATEEEPVQTTRPITRPRIVEADFTPNQDLDIISAMVAGATPSAVKKRDEEEDEEEPEKVQKKTAHEQEINEVKELLGSAKKETMDEDEEEINNLDIISAMVTGMVQQKKTKEPEEDEPEEDEETKVVLQDTASPGVVASKNSNKFHFPFCPYAKNIAEENRITFENESKARDAGFEPCECTK